MSASDQRKGVLSSLFARNKTSPAINVLHSEFHSTYTKYNEI